MGWLEISGALWRLISCCSMFMLFTFITREMPNNKDCFTHTLLGIEDLCAKRDDLHRQILQEEEEKQKIQNDIRILTERLAQVTPPPPHTHTHTHTHYVVNMQHKHTYTIIGMKGVDVFLNS